MFQLRHQVVIPVESPVVNPLVFLPVNPHPHHQESQLAHPRWNPLVLHLESQPVFQLHHQVVIPVESPVVNPLVFLPINPHQHHQESQLALPR